MSRFWSRSPKSGARAPRQAGVLSRGVDGLKRLLQVLATHALQLISPGAAAFPRPDLSHVERLVFVCEANLYRSAFAHALCEQSGLKAASFGLHTQTGRRSPLAAVRAAAALGVPLEAHRATHLRDFHAAPGDLYLVMSSTAAERLQRRGFPADRIALLGLWCRPRRLRIGDPHGKSESRIDSCFASVRTAVTNLGQELRRACLGAAPAGSAGPVDRHAADEAEDCDTAAA